jgi:hypothetical protein
LFRNLPFVFTYLDDHLIASRTMEEHMEHLSQFFQVLQDNGLTINPGKCTFAASQVKFLGHMVSESGITPPPKTCGSHPRVSPTINGQTSSAVPRHDQFLP